MKGNKIYSIYSGVCSSADHTHRPTWSVLIRFLLSCSTLGFVVGRSVGKQPHSHTVRPPPTEQETLGSPYYMLGRLSARVTEGVTTKEGMCHKVCEHVSGSMSTVMEADTLVGTCQPFSIPADRSTQAVASTNGRTVCVCVCVSIPM